MQSLLRDIGPYEQLRNSSPRNSSSKFEIHVIFYLLHARLYGLSGICGVPLSEVRVAMCGRWWSWRCVSELSCECGEV